MFQFQHGTIGSYGKGYQLRILLRFNSSMVRLEGNSENSGNRLLVRFNSSMVRLEDQNRGTAHDLPGVSIPAWYDWKPFDDLKK